MRPCSKLIKVYVMYISKGIMNLMVKAVITSGIISNASLVSTGINYALSNAYGHDLVCNDQQEAKTAHGALLIQK